MADITAEIFKMASHEPIMQSIIDWKSTRDSGLVEPMNGSAKPMIECGNRAESQH